MTQKFQKLIQQGKENRNCHEIVKNVNERLSFGENCSKVPQQCSNHVFPKKFDQTYSGVEQREKQINHVGRT